MKKTKSSAKKPVEAEVEEKKPKTTKKPVVREQRKKVEKVEKEPAVKKQAAFSLQLTRFELLHLRDLMSVLLPPDGAQTLSQALASAEERSLIESMLWEKVSKLCSEAKLPLDAEAPDYIVAPVAPPALGVFQVNQDLSSSPAAKSGFLPGEQSEDPEEQEDNEEV